MPLLSLAEEGNFIQVYDFKVKPGKGAELHILEGGPAVKPSWFGESIGHYKGGDTLVVDTIGLAAGKYHYIDFFRTPHTEKLHVIERFTT